MPQRKVKKSRNSKPTYFKRWLFVLLLKLSLAGITVALLFLAIVWLGFFGKLPSIIDLKNINNNTASVVYCANKTMIGKFFFQNRLTIDNKKISPHVKNALVATEDSRFFEHRGLDFISTARVLVKTVIMRDRQQGGGSTISQQLAKNLFPRRSHGLITLPVNKAREIFIAARLEKAFTKEDLLGLYLNTVPFGENIFGIEVAANRFFGKSSATLTIPEAATLVGMLAANTTFNPRLHPERSKNRRDLVIDRMQEQGFVSKQDAQKYKQTGIKISYSRLDHNHGPAPYFIEQVRIEVERVLRKEHGSKYNIYTDGLRIHTTLDATLQSFAVRALQGHMKYLQKVFDEHWGNRDPWHNNPEVFNTALRNSSRYRHLEKTGLNHARILEELNKPVNTTIFSHEGDIRTKISPADSVKKTLRLLHAGFMAMNPANGHVLAWQGGIRFQHFKFDHVNANRQVGSTFKPILYATALENGFDPCQFISNERRVYSNYKDWSPQNADGKYHGYYSLKGGLVNSVNTISAELINKIGISDVISMARRMGITSSIPHVPSIALGTAEISLKEMITAYTAFANYGTPVKPVILLRIEDARGNVLYQAPPHEPLSPAFKEETARMMIQVMREVVENGTAKALKTRYSLRSDIGGKTGTTQNNADGWFIGFTPNMVAGAWVGAASPSIHFRTLALGQGAYMALPIFGQFMQLAENSPRHRYIASQVFYPVPDELLTMMNCPDFSEDDPTEKNFFERFFERSGKPEPPLLEKGDERKREATEQKPNLLDRMKDVFRKKNE